MSIRFVSALGGALLFFYPGESEWGHYFGLGMLAYALAMWVWYPVRYFRIHSAARGAPCKT